MGTYGVIDFDDEEIEAASHWYGGQGSMLYAITSTGALSRGTIRPRHHEGGLMTDEEWIIDLAERLEGEAESAASDAAKQAKKAKGAEKKELLADREGLRSISFKAGQFVRDSKRAKKTQHSTRPMSSHATKKSPAQLDREISQALSGRRAHSTKGITFDKDDARQYGIHAFRMEQTKAQALAGARDQGFAAHHMGAVEDGWDAERRDTAHGGFVDSSHATRKKLLARR